MSLKSDFHRIRSVFVSEPFGVRIEFENGTEKKYDLNRLKDRPEFALLFRHPAFVKSVRVDPGGYGISWNDDIDLGSEELWNHGMVLKGERQV